VRNEAGAVIGACECFDERELLFPLRPTERLAESIDELTQLPDRQAIVRRIQTDLREFQASHIPFGVLCLGIDNLAGLRVADGPTAVSRFLYATAQTMAKSIGHGNLVGRWSDRHFVAIVRGCSKTELLESAITLKRLGGLEGVPWWGDRRVVTLSVVGTLAFEEDTPEELIRRAEEALNGIMTNEVNQADIV
jgi:diguanylate cyclase (GGDEF)-like protein